MYLAEATNGLSDALSNFSTVIASVVSVITGNTIIMTMFAGGLFAVAAKVFKRIKNAVK